MCIKRDILLIFKTQPCFVITETTVMNWLNGAVVVPPLSLAILVAEIVLYPFQVRFHNIISNITITNYSNFGFTVFMIRRGRKLDLGVLYILSQLIQGIVLNTSIILQINK